MLHHIKCVVLCGVSCGAVCGVRCGAIFGNSCILATYKNLFFAKIAF